MFDRTDLWAIPLLVVLWGMALWGLWSIGSYEYTGIRGSRRVIAGWRLLVLLLHLDLRRQLAKWEAHIAGQPPNGDGSPPTTAPIEPSSDE